MKHVNADANMIVVEPDESLADTDAPLGKAHILVACKDEDGVRVRVRFTLNVLGMAGGMAKGVAGRFKYKW